MIVPPKEAYREIDVDALVNSSDDRDQARPNIWSGLALTVLIAATAFVVQRFSPLSVFSPIILSITLGFILRSFVSVPESVRPGIAFSMRKVLRFAIITLGLQLTVSQLAGVGVAGMAVVSVTLGATFMFTLMFGSLIGVDRRLSELIAAGTSICGASAVIATNTVTRAPDEDVAYAVACVTVFGSIAMFTYPVLPSLLHLDPHAFGLWSGASIHEIAQVVAAAYQDGDTAGEFGTIAKLARVILLAPVVLCLGVLTARRARSGEGPAGRPWFVVGFIAMVVINSIFDIPKGIRGEIANVTTFLLAMALAAMGLETDIRKLCARGMRPLLLGAAASVFISCFSLGMIKLLM